MIRMAMCEAGFHDAELSIRGEAVSLNCSTAFETPELDAFMQAAKLVRERFCEPPSVIESMWVNREGVFAERREVLSEWRWPA